MDIPRKKKVLSSQQKRNSRKKEEKTWFGSLMSITNQKGIEESLRRRRLTRKERIHEDIAAGKRPDYPWYHPQGSGYQPRKRKR